MLKIKYFFAIGSIILFLLSACKDDEPNYPPMITINGDAHHRATIKHSVQNKYEFVCELTDENNPIDIKVRKIDNAIVWDQLDTPIEGIELPIHGDSKTLILGDFVAPQEERSIDLDVVVEVKDVDDVRGEVGKLTLTVLGNYLPKANISDIGPDTNNFPYAHNIDGCNSIDGDADYGGEIVKYRFTIVGDVEGVEEELFYVYEGDDCKINYAFPGSGIYTITLEVMDNDGAWSEKTDTIHTIN